jgi:hypothetical protein
MDPVPGGVLLFDMTAMEWKDAYDANADPYESANRIKKWYENGYVSPAFPPLYGA